VGKFRDGSDKVIGSNAPPRYDPGRPLSRKRWRTSRGRLFLSNVIVKIHTDDGITGIGEAACDDAEPVDVVTAMIDRHMAPELIGEDPMNWEYLIDLVSADAARGAARFSTSGIDLALHDLVAKAFGVPDRKSTRLNSSHDYRIT
jgi:L-alanine-DL-glutamate epimerase-like enolase superfamily enzyme